MPLGSTASFTVQASGSAPLTYQWRQNGASIAGATGSSYQTSATTLSDNSSVYAVVVSNAAGSAQSGAAKLSIGPRSPLSGDLRFKAVDYAQSLVGYQYTNIDGLLSTTFTNLLGTPLEMGAAGACGSSSGPYDCAWLLAVFRLPAGVTGINTIYQSDLLTNLDAEIQSLTMPNTVVTSLDERGSNDVYALSAVQNLAGSGFDLARHTIEQSDLQNEASVEGQAGRVITAITVNPAQQVDFLSYGWQGDSGTAYDVQTVLTTESGVEAQAADLAAAGYIITAVGAGVGDGFVLVGTKVAGDTLPRPFAINTDFTQGYASVGKVFDLNGNTSLGEK